MSDLLLEMMIAKYFPIDGSIDGTTSLASASPERLYRGLTGASLSLGLKHDLLLEIKCKGGSSIKTLRAAAVCCIKKTKKVT